MNIKLYPAEIKNTPVIDTWLFKFSRQLAILPFDSEGVMSNCHLIYSALILGTVSWGGAAARIAIFTADYDPQSVRNFSDSVLPLFLNLCLTCTCVTHVYQCYRHKLTFKLVLTASKWPQKEPIWNSTWLVIGIVSHVVMFLSSLKSDQYRLLGISVALPAFWSFVIALQFNSILNCLAMEMNRTIRSYSKRIFVNKHSQVVAKSAMANKAYQWQLFFLSVQIFGYTVSYLYFIIVEWDVVYDMLGYYLSMIVSRLMMLYVITNSCELFYQQAEAFNNELFKLMRESKELCSDNKLLLYVTMRQTVNFTACGFFNLGYPLVTSIIAAATTYLVILIQFSMPKA